MDYSSAGVSLERADEAMGQIKDSVKSTFNDRVVGDLGSFGGLFSIANLGMEDPILVTSVDGVGTKLKLSFEMGCHERPGQDIVNHCVDDILVMGARPLVFLDYVGLGRLEPSTMGKLVAGMAKACRENGCVLIGGETAEMPGFYQVGEYDIAGTIVGVVDRPKAITGEKIRPGDVILGLKSTGLHTNGYSLARKALLDSGLYKVDTHLDELGTTVGDALSVPHRSYLKPLWPLVDRREINGLVHITGSGYQGNIPRVLPADCDAVIDRKAWEVPAIFNVIQKAGDVERDEMYRVFNMGLGMLVVVSPDKADAIKAELEAAGESVVVAGRIEKGSKSVRFSS